MASIMAAERRKESGHPGQGATSRHRQAPSAEPIRILKPERDVPRPRRDEFKSERLAEASDATETLAALTDSSSTASLKGRHRALPPSAQGEGQRGRQGEDRFRDQARNTGKSKTQRGEDKSQRRTNPSNGHRDDASKRAGPEGISIIPRPRQADVDARSIGSGSLHGSLHGVRSERSAQRGASGLTMTAKDRSPLRSTREKGGRDARSRLDSDVRSQASSRGPQGGSGRLFDPRRDDPVKFQSSVRGASTTDGMSAPSIASRSDSRSIASSTPSNTTPSQASNNSRERRRRKGKDTLQLNGTSAVSSQGSVENSSYVSDLKRRYREITQLEQQLRELPQDVLHALRNKFTAHGTLDEASWQPQVALHQQLAEAHVLFMEAAFRPGLPASLQSLPRSYNIPSRLWQGAFQNLIDKLEECIPNLSCGTLDHSARTRLSQSETRFASATQDVLTDFIYYAYTFYSNLQESEQYKSFRAHWTESLGDLASYRASIAQRAAPTPGYGIDSSSDRAHKSGAEPLEPALVVKAKEDGDGTDADPAASPAPQEFDAASVGSNALRDWDLEEVDIWKNTAESWYARALSGAPGNGRIYHRLAMLYRGIDDMKSLYFFCKSTTASRSFLNARESVLALFSRTRQEARTRASASLVDRFVHLHGILLTRVQVDEFLPSLKNFTAQLEKVLTRKDGISASDAMMMATINIAATQNYATVSQRSSSRETETLGRRRDKQSQRRAKTQVMDDVSSDESSSDDDGEDVDTDTAPGHKGIEAAQQQPFEEAIFVNDIPRLSARLAIETLTTILRFLPASTLADSGASAYITTFLMFLAHQYHTPGVFAAEDIVPWSRLVDLSEGAPQNCRYLDLPDLSTLHRIGDQDGPLPEDYCVRGMAWVGRHMYERGFWKVESSVDEQREDKFARFDSELDVIASAQVTSNDETSVPPPSALAAARWNRIVFALLSLAKHVPGMDCHKAEDGRLRLSITSPLLDKIEFWEALHEQENAISAMKSLQIDSALGEVADAHPSTTDLQSNVISAPGDSSRTKQRSAQPAKTQAQPMQKSDGRTNRGHNTARIKPSTDQPSVVPGYTTLVIDTNVIVAPDDILSTLVESGKWFVIVPLPVVTELDGLSRREGDVGMRAKDSLRYLETTIKTKSLFIKVQTSRGNYLGDLSLRTEQIDFQAQTEQHPSSQGESADLTASTTARPEVSEEDRCTTQPADGKNEAQVQSNVDSVLPTKGARSVDDVILRCLSWQASDAFWRNRLLLLCTDNAERAARQSKIVLPGTNQAGRPPTSRAVLVTLDRNLRLKARSRELDVVAPRELP